MGTYGYDREFMKQYHETIELSSEDNASKILLVPDFQGRVMTSTSNGDSGSSFGWINYDLIASGELDDQMNAYGGEDRFWLGPEGGQYSLFFSPGRSFEFDNWKTPAPIDSEPFEIEEVTEKSVVFKRSMTLINYQNIEFNIGVERKINLLSHSEITRFLGIDIPSGVSGVAYESENRIINQGNDVWEEESGLISIWILGMYNPSDESVVFVPYRDTPQINSNYFGKIPAERFAVKEKMIYLKADGKSRSKIGIPPVNVIPIMGSYDPENRVLTVVQYTFEGDSNYVNSMWEWQEHPFRGDVANAYNDGPLSDGSQMGPFYELESSSKAAALNPGQNLLHIHRTFHFQGSTEDLDNIIGELFPVNIKEITSAFP